MTGDLTIKGVTQPVTLAVVKYGEFNDPRMGHRIGYSAEGRINRKDFGMTYNMMLDGKWIIGDEVQIHRVGLWKIRADVFQHIRECLARRVRFHVGREDFTVDTDISDFHRIPGIRPGVLMQTWSADDAPRRVPRLVKVDACRVW